jgi:serine/threonine protein kinase
VYRATDLQAESEPSRQSEVAIKIIRPDMRQRSSMNERLQREFGYTASLHHPNIVRVFDLDAHDEIPFFSMEYLDGEPLHVRVQRPHPQAFALAEALRILQACGAALAYAHERGILHCDFKPSNVLLTTDGRIKVLDFGAARAFTSDLGINTKRPESATPAYASPQLLAAERPDVRDDVFSLACVAYELFAGQHPFGGLSAVEMFSRGKALIRPGALNDARWRAIESALRIEREARPASVSAFLEAFETPSDTSPSTPSPVPATGSGRSSSILTATVLLGLGIAIGSWLQTEHGSATAPTKPKIAAGAGISVPHIQQTIANYRTTIPSAVVENAFLPMPPLFLLPLPKAAVAFAATRELPSAANPIHTAAVSYVAKKAKLVADGMVTLEQSRLEVSGRSIAAVLTLRRTGAPTGRVSVQWRTQGGTARPSLDYEPVADEVASLADGQAVRAIFIPIKQNSTRGMRTFNVEIKDAKGASLGGITRAVVTIK